MPNPSQVVGDEDAFLNELNDVEEKLSQIRSKVHGKSLTTICLTCAEQIGKERLKALPNTTICIHCANDLEIQCHVKSK